MFALFWQRCYTAKDSSESLTERESVHIQYNFIVTTRILHVCLCMSPMSEKLRGPCCFCLKQYFICRKYIHVNIIHTGTGSDSNKMLIYKPSSDNYKPSPGIYIYIYIYISHLQVYKPSPECISHRLLYRPSCFWLIRPFVTLWACLITEEVYILGYSS